jgi:hypothetical protein
MDTDRLDVAIVDRIFRDHIPDNYDRYEDPLGIVPFMHVYPLLQIYDADTPFSYTIPDIPSDTIPCLVPNPETSLEGDMREWIRNQ